MQTIPFTKHKVSSNVNRVSQIINLLKKIVWPDYPNFRCELDFLKFLFKLLIFSNFPTIYKVLNSTQTIIYAAKSKF